MGKQKYYYNTETCKFEKVKKTKKEQFLNITGFLTLILITSIGLVSIYDAYFESPKIIQLKKENRPFISVESLREYTLSSVER